MNLTTKLEYGRKAEIAYRYSRTYISDINCS